jgi:hypothetical protein
MTSITAKEVSPMPGTSLLEALHGSMRETRARSSFGEKLTGLAFLVRRASQNETLILAVTTFVHDKNECPRSSESSTGALTESESESILDAQTREKDKTTLVLTNLPFLLNRDMLLEVLRAKDFMKFVDFVYLPFEFAKRQFYGRAYINFTTAAVAEECLTVLNGCIDWGLPSAEPCEAFWCARHQGLEELIEHFRDSQIMHEKIIDDYKPVLLRDCIRIVFPPPTKKIKGDRRKNCLQYMPKAVKAA